MKEAIPEYDRIRSFDQDIHDSRNKPQWNGKESTLPNAIVEDLVAEADDFLKRHEIESWEKLEEMLEELDTAIAINNDPHARELRKMIAQRYNEGMLR